MASTADHEPLQWDSDGPIERDQPPRPAHHISSIEMGGNLRAVVVCGECGGTFVLASLVGACPWCEAQLTLTVRAEPLNRARDGTYLQPNRYPRGSRLVPPPTPPRSAA